MRVGDNLAAAVAGTDDQGKPVGIPFLAWSSSAPAIATVSGAGVVSAVSVGSASITATSGHLTASSSLRVIAAALPGSRLFVSPGEGTLSVGHTIQLFVTLVDPHGVELDGRAVTWSSGATAVATVTPDGIVTAQRPGSAIIVADAEGLSATAPITVVASFDSGVGVTIETPAANQLVGDTLKVVATANPPQDAVSAIATVGPKQASLGVVPVGARGSGTGWGGSVDLSDIHFGLYYVVVTVTDKLGRQGADSVLFERNPLKLGGGSVTGPPKLKSLRPATPRPPTHVRPRPGGA